MSPVELPFHSQRLVIGIGNPLRGDDGVGDLLARQAAERIGAAPCLPVEVRRVQQLMPELAEDLSQTREVLFIDAWRAPADASPLLRPLSPATAMEAATNGAGLASHRLDAAALLAMSLALYGSAPVAHLLLVPAHAFPHGTALSPGLQAALPQARALLHQWLGGDA